MVKDGKGCLNPQRRRLFRTGLVGGVGMIFASLRAMGLAGTGTEALSSAKN